jgi:hypothetical protein
VVTNRALFTCTVTGIDLNRWSWAFALTSKSLGTPMPRRCNKRSAPLRRLLFVGCREGMLDPNFGALLKWSARVFAGSEYRHFLLTRESEVSALQNQRLLGERIVVLSYGNAPASATRRRPCPSTKALATSAARPTASKASATSLLARSDHEEARRRFEEALGHYEQIQEPYSIGWIHRRLARIARNDNERSQQVAAASTAWQSIGRDDLVESLNYEFGQP